MLLGGGRCTAGGCMCYHAYFDQEGSPISRYILVYRVDGVYVAQETERNLATADLIA